MADRPILFSAPMVRALLAGTKTQTRRVARDTTLPHLRRDGDLHVTTGAGMLTKNYYFRVPYAVGDRLYVREAWHAARSLDRTVPRDIPRDADVEHAATARSYAEIGLKGKLRPGMHMPRCASRLTLTVTEVRVQRLQEISASDAIAEGVEQTEFWKPRELDGRPFEEKWWDDATFWSEYPQIAFRNLWDSLNADRGFGWDVNPWVVAVTFTVERRNIDEVA